MKELVKFMSELTAAMISYSIFFLWIAGIVIAKGFWSTFFSIFIPPYALYLIVERLLSFGGII